VAGTLRLAGLGTNRETVGNLRLGIFSSQILKTVTWNSNRGFAISHPSHEDQGLWRFEAGRWKLKCDREAQSAEMGMAANGGGRVEL